MKRRLPQHEAIMRNRDEELIAALLGEESPSPALRQWLTTTSGQRELAAYRQTLRRLGAAYAADEPIHAPTVFYTVLTTPIGPLVIAVTSVGLARVSFRRSAGAVVRELEHHLGAEVRESRDHVGDIVTQLNAYFAGRRRTFDLPIDLSLATPFQRRVLVATSGVPAGEVASYADIARRIGQPHANRAVGQALGSNPIPIVIPCHRIVASGGGLGGYGGGLTIKKKLLALEGAEVAER